MNIKEGINRISLIVAVISMIPGYLIGSKHYRETMQIVNPGIHELEEQGWESVFGEHFYDKHPEWEIVFDKSFFDEYPNMVGMQNHGAFTVLKLMVNPPGWKCFIAGAVGSLFGFLIMLFGIRGARKLTVWIIGGFRDK